MPTFMTISKHFPENCPMFFEKNRKLVLEIGEKLEGLAKKHGVKVVGIYSVHSEHLVVQIYEAPSFEAFQKFNMEPEIKPWFNFNTVEVKSAHTFEETIKIMKQAKPAK